MDSRYLDTIKRFEGFAAHAKWDYAQFTNGYGTKATHPGEAISKEEADQRFRKEIAEATRLVDSFSSDLDPGTRAALTSLTFNAGTRWMSAGLGEAIKAGNLDEGRQIFLQYNKAGGEVLPGLVRRRIEEAKWMGSTADDPGTNMLQQTNLDADAWKTVTYLPANPVLAGVGNQVAESTPEAVALLEQVRIEQWRVLAFEYGRTQLGREDEATTKV